MKRIAPLLAVLVATVLAQPARAAGNPIDAISVTAGVQGRWLDGGFESPNRDVEAAGNAALGLTPHVVLTGGAAFGVSGNYLRAQTDARVIASDINNRGFAVWLGVGRYFSKDASDGLDEWAYKGGLGWHPFQRIDGSYQPVLVGLTAASGIDTDRRCVTLSVLYEIKGVK